jgi:hypothetical protein
MEINKIISLTKKTDFLFAVDTFLDEFRRSEDKLSLLIDEPLESQILTQNEYSILASIVEKLVHDFQLVKVPKWVFKEKYFLKAPFFQFDTKNKEYQDFLIKNAIPEFSKRNLYFDENSIKRI